MVCRKCGRELLDDDQACKFCGTMPDKSWTTGPDVPKKKTFKEKVEIMDTGAFLIAMIVIPIMLLVHWNKVNNFNKMVYSQAVQEVRNHTGKLSNVEIGKYDKDYVNIQEWDCHDFGYGYLRYGRYAVTVPLEYDDLYGHYEQNFTVNVYYYTSDQQFSEGVDPSVEDHFWTPDMFQEKWGQMFEDWQ